MKTETIETEARMMHDRAVIVAAQNRIEVEAARLQKAEDAERRAVNERAAAEKLEVEHAKVREADRICRCLVDEQNEVEQKLRGVIFHLETEEIERLLLRRMALEARGASLNAERPGILKRFREAETAYARAKEHLAELENGKAAHI